MNRAYPQPTIIGSDLTGLLISIALSNAEIDHVLIRSAPTDDSLHHGETTSMVAPIIFLQFFPELMHCVYEKKFGIVHASKYSIKLDFSHPSLLPMKVGLKFFEQIDFTFPLQIDRVGLDQALFEKATRAPYCTHLDTTIEHIAYDAAADRVQQVTLADGTTLPTSHLFDASAQECVVGRQLGLPTRQIDEPYFMVQAYFHADAPLPKLRQMGWCDELNIMRLYQHEWGVDGIATLIPLGNRLSLRVCAPQGQLEAESAAEEKLLEIAERAFFQLGIPYRELFPQQKQVHSEVNEQYVHERAYGANWLLTGMAYCNTLVTTAISADTAFEALHVGPGFLKRSGEMGRYYQRYMDYYLKMHGTWRELVCHDPAVVTEDWAQKMTDRYLWANGMQQYQSLLLQQFDNPLRIATELSIRISDAMPLPPFAAPYRSVHRRGSILD